MLWSGQGVTAPRRAARAYPPDDVATAGARAARRQRARPQVRFLVFRGSIRGSETVRVV